MLFQINPKHDWHSTYQVGQSENVSQHAFDRHSLLCGLAMLQVRSQHSLRCVLPCQPKLYHDPASSSGAANGMCPAASTCVLHCVSLTAALLGHFVPNTATSGAAQEILHIGLHLGTECLLRQHKSLCIKILRQADGMLVQKAHTFLYADRSLIFTTFVCIANQEASLRWEALGCRWACVNIERGLDDILATDMTTELIAMCKLASSLEHICIYIARAAPMLTMFVPFATP